jgi:hypothetical protein
MARIMPGTTGSMQRFIIGMLALVATLVVARGELHAGESSRLAYLRGAGAGHCPDEQTLRSAVAVRLGYDPFVAWAKTIVHAELGRDGSNLRARIYLADEDGHIRGSRELAAPSDQCQNLVAAVALAISIAIDPMSASAPSPAHDPPRDPEEVTRQAPEEDRTSVPIALPPSSDAGERASGERQDAAVSEASNRVSMQSPMQWFAGAGPHLATGTAPKLAAGLTAFARLELGAASLGLEARYDFPASANAPSGKGVVSSELLLASLEPCGRVSRLYFCALLSVGSLRGSGAGVAMPFDRSTLYWGAGGRIAFELGVVAPMLLRAHLDVVGNFTRTTLQIDRSDVWQSPPLAAALGISAVGRIW